MTDDAHAGQEALLIYDLAVLAVEKAIDSMMLVANTAGSTRATVMAMTLASFMVGDRARIVVDLMPPSERETFGAIMAVFDKARPEALAKLRAQMGGDV